MKKPGNEDDENNDFEAVIETLAKESNIREDTIRENVVDKIHLLGKPDRDGHQLRIVKFTSDSFKETVFKRHKSRVKTYIANQKKKKKPPKIDIKLQPSLTKQRLDLLKIASDRTREMEDVKFPYADMHGNLKLILNNPIKNRYVIDFKTEEDITNIITLLGPEMACIDEDFEEYDDQD